jgi:hypothetical protein
MERDIKGGYTRRLVRPLRYFMSSVYLNPPQALFSAVKYGYSHRIPRVEFGPLLTATPALDTRVHDTGCNW